jgi:hypothetical protein
MGTKGLSDGSGYRRYGREVEYRVDVGDEVVNRVPRQVTNDQDGRSASQVLAAAGREIVDYRHRVIVGDQPTREMRSDEAGASGDQRFQVDPLRIDKLPVPDLKHEETPEPVVGQRQRDARALDGGRLRGGGCRTQRASQHDDLVRASVAAHPRSQRPDGQT